MGRMIRIELYRAFHGKELKAAMLLGGLLGVAHFVLEVIPLVKHIFDGYNPYIASSVVRNVSEGWMGGMINAEINIYQMVVFLLITIPYAASYYTDRKSGILKNLVIRGEKSIYTVAKSIAVFITAGVSAVFPLLLNLKEKFKCNLIYLVTLLRSYHKMLSYVGYLNGRMKNIKRAQKNISF